MTVPHEFCFYEERASTSSTSSIELNTTTLDTNEHLLEFVITTVDQIDLAIYSSLESMTKKVPTHLIKTLLLQGASYVLG